MTPLLLIHICTATVGLFSGFLAIALRKGSGLHRAAGNVFFISMLIMSGAGAYMAAFVKPNSGNIQGGVLTFYLVATGWAAAKRDRKVGIFDWSALLGALALATASVTWGLEAARAQSGSKDGYPSAAYFVFASITLLFASSDVRMIVRGGVSGGQRIARHLLRMNLALLIATVSFYPSRAHLFPTWLRETNLLYVPHVLLVGSTVFWLVRMSARKRVQRNNVIDVGHGEAIAGRTLGATGAI